ncbi:MAG: 6-carboxytetrahydropterin synthase [Candidatus Palauibacterales bacterium]|nr:6-carboxytetrahydropterin synthase [Candidatus Palauibacterales bacterium]
MEGHYEMETDETYRVRVGEEALYFSAAHFITYGGSECEHLHGHNYRVQVALGGTLNRNAYVYDFVRLRELVADLLSELDHRLLLPEENPAFEIRRSRDEVEVAVRGREYRFPSSDVVHLPVRNTTAEELASHLADRIVAAIEERGELDGLDDLEVEVEESPGQSAVHRRSLPAP